MANVRGMVTASEIGDEESLRAWLAGRTSEDAVPVAVRSALRVAPLVWARPEQGRERDIENLAICRALLVAGVAVKSATPIIREAANDAFTAAYSAADKDAAEDDDQASTRYAAAEAAFVASGTPIGADYAVSAAARAACAGGAAIWWEVREDARRLEGGEDPLSAPFWMTAKPNWFTQADAGMRAIWQEGHPEHWSFWLRWWDGVLSGQQLDWALQEKVALIPHEVWEQGAAAVAAEIARIEEQLRLQNEVARLRDLLAKARAEIAAITNRAHNNPPELVEPAGELQHHANEIAAALSEAEKELAKDAPRPALLRRIGARLRGAAGKSLAYCASLGDTALQKAAAEIGSAGGKALIGAGLLTWLSQMEAVKSLARALEAFARMLGG